MKSELKHFAVEGFEDAEHHRQVADVPGFWTEVEHIFNPGRSNKLGIFNMLMLK
jgi:hypothetical protein